MRLRFAGYQFVLSTSNLACNYISVVVRAYEHVYIVLAVHESLPCFQFS